MLLAGLQALAKREQGYQGRFEALRQDVLIGAAEAERGQLLDATTKIEAIWQRITSPSQL